ncbi:ATP-dependent DNA helicase [Acidimicrobiia bacterium EGI L10123]|uniref:ATP-dependent DNA helicase n=1 Tax=Salinilacustrithrix flava TaxID=2957203 RepID=UPI003D7C33B0|nr:ATP-dependent DNA helicase [Acidimicrobiia bacterium EGI L10123]
MAAPEIAETLEKVVAQLPGGGEVRDGQRVMAEAVADAIESGRHLVVQAGTGTGKTLAYLVPAVVTGARVVVATATKALQDQLAGKDLPFLDAHVGGFSWAILKGRSNYVCRQRVAELLDDRQGRLDVANDDPGLTAVLEWANETEIGDRAELALEPRAAVWDAVSVGSDECPGASKCPMGETCFAEGARRRAAEADVIVVNTHLYGTHVAAGGVVLPPHDLVVLDEAHRVEEVVSSTSGSELTSGRISAAAYAVGRVIADDALVTDILAISARIADVLDDLVGQRLDPPPARLVDQLTQLRTKLDAASAALKGVPESNVDVVARRNRASQQLLGLSEAILRASVVPTGSVAWVEGRPGSAKLRIAPIDVAGLLEELLWRETTAVLCSATIPPKLPTRLGLPKGNTTEINVGSPFDYEANAVLYCATHLPDPRQERADAVHDEIAALIEAAGGRTMALFTSWKAMQAAVEALRPRLDTPVLAQGEQPKPALLSAFTDEPAASLFATMSFWEGVDVPGPSLSCVIIDKLPFARPDDPLLEARREQVGRRAFELIDLPRASTLLAQGAGRLIRTAEDTGVVAVLDPRLATAGYRWDLIRGLPPMRRTKDRAEVLALLGELR